MPNNKIVLDPKIKDKINELIIGNTKLFQNAHDSNKPKAIKNKQPFHTTILGLVTNVILRNSLLSYAAGKKENAFEDVFGDEYEAQKDKRTPFINTPHPIGNLSAKQNVLLDFINIINCAEIRILVGQEAEKPSKAEHKAQEKYSDQNIKNIRAKFFKSIIQRINDEGILDNTTLSEINNIMELQLVIAQQFISLQIDTQVISPEEQAEYAAIKMGHLAKQSTKKRINQSWINVDSDGDPRVSVDQVLPGIEGKTFAEVFAAYNKDLSLKKKSEEKSGNIATKEAAFETRISCAVTLDEDGNIVSGKKGVDGPVVQFSIIPGVSGIESIPYILDPKNFEQSYQELSKYLSDNNTKYTKQSGINKDSDANFINNPLDLLLRSALPHFVNASGFVLSDFPENKKEAEQLLAQLLFTFKATQRYLSEIATANDSPFSEKTQKFLPLCETEKSIDEFIALMKIVFDKIIIAATAAKDNEDLSKEIVELFGAKGQFAFGGFFGPSDLTANMGGIALVMLNNSSNDLASIYKQFQAEVKEANPLVSFDEVELVREYGKGSSPKRGGNFVIEDVSRTNQGLSISSVSGPSQKNYSRNSVPFSSRCDIAAMRKKATAIHLYFFDRDEDNPGLFAGEYTKKLDNHTMLPVAKRFSNPQGTRGGKGLLPAPFYKQRAIGLGGLTSYCGLLQAPTFPVELIEVEEKTDTGTKTIAKIGTKLEWPKFREFINHPAGFATLLGEFWQLCNMDFDRAKILGFSDHLIDESLAYVNVVSIFLSKELGLDPKKIETSKDLRALVDEVVDTLRTGKDSDNKEFISSAYLKRRLDTFSEQITMIGATSAELTKMVEEISKAKDTELEYLCANAAVLVGTIANFEMPYIASVTPAQALEIQKKEANSDEKQKLITNPSGTTKNPKATAAVTQSSHAVGKD